MIPRRRAWMRQERGSVRASNWAGEKVVLDIGDFGLEMVNDYPIYDNGDFFVIDTVKDLEWTVVWHETGHSVGRATIDKYEAIRWADEYQEAGWPEVK